MKNVILYCRVSSDEQKTNTSLDFQEKKLRQHCDKNSYNVIACYKEDYSAKHHDFVRPEMKKIRDYCKAHKNEVDMILFLRWDRFARNPEFAYAFKRIFMDEWGIEFNALESPIDFSATEWSSSLGNYCAAAHTENNKISRRTRDGVRETLLSGRLANKAPRGYKNVHITDDNGITIAKTIEIDEEKAPLIRAIFNEVAKGVEVPCAIRRRIAPEIPESTFLDLLRNIFYKGKIRVPATKTEPEVIVDGQHTPLVTEELFDTVQEIMDGKRKKQPKLTKPIKPEFYLRKYLVCPHCGYEYIAGFSEKKRYEACPSCGKTTKEFCTLYIGKNAVVLELGKRIYKSHIDKYSSEYNKSIGLVVANKNNPALWGIKLALVEDVEIKDSEGNVKTVSGTGVIPIVKNLKIKFNENTIGEIR